MNTCEYLCKGYSLFINFTDIGKASSSVVYCLICVMTMKTVDILTITDELIHTLTVFTYS